MSYRFMRIIVFFDLPVATLKDRREYSKFRRFLVKSGFIMLQESVYCKLAQNQSAADSISDSLRKNKPPKGIVQTLVITEKQYSRMEFIIGSGNSDIISSDKRFIEL